MLISEPLGGTVDFPHQISNHSGISPRKLVELWYQPLIICNTKFTTQILQGKQQQQNQSSYKNVGPSNQICSCTAYVAFPVKTFPGKDAIHQGFY